MRYTSDQAANYDSIALENSTFEVSLLPAITCLGDLTGLTVLDFGSGTGRSARALKDSGARHVVAVDKDESMLNAARRYPGVAYLRIGQSLPIKEKSVDAAICANVLSEFSRVDDIAYACRQVWRALDIGRYFVLVAPNPESVSCDYVSYRYIDAVAPSSGSPMTCLLKGATSTLIQDYFWTTDDYIGALKAAGFAINKILLPTASGDSGVWLDETRVAPDLAIHAIRTNGL
jgi:ubiquinone/menaquinone biosynthesis C-methylase UbiE